MDRNNWKGWLYLLPAFIFLGVFMIYPLVDVFVYSFEEGYNSASQSFFGTGWYNYSYVLHDPYFLQALKNTLILVAVSLPLLFRFIVEKGRLAFLLLTVIVAVGIQMTADQTVWILDRFGFYGALVVLAVLLNVGSVLLSCRFYRRRVW